MMEESHEQRCPTGVLIDLSDAEHEKFRFPKSFFGSTNSLVNISPVQHEHPRELAEDASPIFKIGQLDCSIPAGSSVRYSGTKLNVSSDSDVDLLENVTLDLDRSSDESIESKEECFFVDTDREIEKPTRSKHQYNLSIQEIVEVFKEATSVAIQLRNYGRGIDKGSPTLSMPFKRRTSLDSRDCDKEGSIRLKVNSTFNMGDLKPDVDEERRPINVDLHLTATDGTSTTELPQAFQTAASKSPETCHSPTKATLELKLNNDVASKEEPTVPSRHLVSEAEDGQSQSQGSPRELWVPDEGPKSKVTHVLQDINATDKWKSSTKRNSSLDISLDSEKENGLRSGDQSITISQELVPEIEMERSQLPKLPLQIAVPRDISTTALTQVLHSNRKKAVTQKSPKTRNAPMKALIVTNPLNGLKNDAVIKTRSHSDGSDFQSNVKKVSKLTNQTRTGFLSDSIPTNSTGGTSKAVRKSTKIILPSPAVKPNQSSDLALPTGSQTRRSHSFTPISKVNPTGSTNGKASPRRPSVTGTIVKHGNAALVERQQNEITPKVCLTRRKSYGVISSSSCKSSPPAMKEAPSSVVPARRRSGIPGLTFVTPPKMAKNGASNSNATVRRSSSFGGQIKKFPATPVTAETRKQLFQHRTNV